MVQDRDGGLGLDNEERLPWLEPVNDFDDDGSASPARLLVIVLGGLLLIGAVLGGLWWYQNGGPRGDGELILAEPGEYKTAPTSDGAKVFEGEGDAAFAASEGVLPDGTVDPNRLPEEPAVTPEEREAAAKKAAADKLAREQLAKADAAKVLAAEAKAAAAKSALVQKQSADVAVAAPKAAPATGTVQLGAFSSEGAANKAWTTLSSRFSYLGQYSRSIAPAKVGSGTVYRLRVGAGSSANAEALCQRLKVAGEGCVIVR
jgi:hypothetical protein